MKTHQLWTGIAFLFSFLYVVSVTAPFAQAAEDVKETTTKTAAHTKAVKKEAKKETAGYYVGSKEGHTYHDPSSRIAKKIKPENLVKFESKAEAEKAGYSPSKVLS